MAESWKEVAHTLAARLSHATEPDHNPPMPDCPFCDDALAFARFLAKRKAIGRPYADPFAGAVMTPIRDLPRTPTLRGPTS